MGQNCVLMGSVTVWDCRGLLGSVGICLEALGDFGNGCEVLRTGGH